MVSGHAGERLAGPDPAQPSTPVSMPAQPDGRDAGPTVTDAVAEAESTEITSSASAEARRGRVLEVFLVALRLGLTSFGGPIAHLGYFRAEYVVKRRWLDERSYADLVGLCQFLPGAASSKAGMSIGIIRAGLLGGLVAWIGFTLPSAIVLVVVALLLRGASADAVNLLHGLKVVAVAIVAQAVWGMARNLAPDRARFSIAVAASAGVFFLPTAIGQIAVIAAAALIGLRFLRTDAAPESHPLRVSIPRWLSVGAWVLLGVLLVGLPILRGLVHSQTIAMTDAFFRSGALVFGGGHVVLPLLRAEMVPTGWISDNQFLAGYGVAQAVPGPLFTFAAYLGAAVGPKPNGVLGATLGLFAIFLPSALLTLGALPLWGTLRYRPSARAALRGVNAAVVGILLAALYNPVWTTAVQRPIDFVLALAAFALLIVWKSPPWVVVLVTGVAGAIAALL